MRAIKAYDILQVWSSLTDKWLDFATVRSDDIHIVKNHAAKKGFRVISGNMPDCGKVLLGGK